MIQRSILLKGDGIACIAGRYCIPAIIIEMGSL